jgi:predicted nuclease of restriction endonuclease-like (RecB) superfamily
MTGGKRKDLPVPVSAVDGLFDRVVAILDRARDRVVRSVNSEMVIAYWYIGREIVEHLQAGEERAAYGRRLLESLAERLGTRYGRGFSVTNLRYFRLFYQAYADRSPEIRHKPCDELDVGGTGQNHHKAGDASVDLALAASPADPIPGFASGLSWSHYRTLTKVEHRVERLFYEIEAEKQSWSVPQLERQIDSLLFARLLKSRDKAGLLELSTRGQVIEKPADALKDPYKLQAFLLELGKGFAFVARQKRLAFQDEHFYVDLVFYNTILKCFLLIDLKVGKLSHQDIGQMDSYVRLFDDQCTTEDDSPTIGLILCARKNEAIARYSVLHESRQIFAARYLQVLPTEEELRRELERERRLLEMQHGPEEEPEEQ